MYVFIKLIGNSSPEESDWLNIQPPFSVVELVVHEK